MQDVIQYADLIVDTASRQTMQSGKPVMLTDTEYRLLVYLLRHQGVVCRRDDIIQQVWGERFLYDTGTLDVHLSSLRHKLGWTKDGPVCVIFFSMGGLLLSVFAAVAAFIPASA